MLPSWCPLVVLRAPSALHTPLALCWGRGTSRQKPSPSDCPLPLSVSSAPSLALGCPPAGHPGLAQESRAGRLPHSLPPTIPVGVASCALGQTHPHCCPKGLNTRAYVTAHGTLLGVTGTLPGRRGRSRVETCMCTAESLPCSFETVTALSGISTRIQNQLQWLQHRILKDISLGARRRHRSDRECLTHRSLVHLGVQG